MTIYTHGTPSVTADIGEINPQLINVRLLKDILEIIEKLKTLKEKGISAELIAATSIKKFDETLTNSIKKTKKVLRKTDNYFTIRIYWS